MNIKDKFKLFQWLEILIWLLILSVALLGIKQYRYEKHKELKHYQIFMPDVDGLISGSPVRMMGVQIGYVEMVKIVGDEVYVKFVLTNNDVTLPKGIIATVEFSGMAGSKSLEIYPPDSTSLAGGKLINVQSPKRLNDALGLLCDMFNQLGAMMQKSSHFSEEIMKYIPEPQSVSVEERTNSLKQINDYLETLSQKKMEIQKKIKEGAKNE